MPPETESNMQTKFYRGFELVDANDPAIPISSTISSDNSPQHVPNNSFATGQAPARPPANALPPGNFSLFTSCFPSFSNLFPTWQRTGQITSSRQQSNQDTNDNYEIALECIEINFKEDYIGGGNQSSVFKGKWNGRQIALKKLNRTSEVNIRQLIVLNHENVVKTIGICSKDLYPCIIMEYCQKGALFDLLRKEHVGKHKFLRWAREIASGMHYLHNDYHIIHRDLKSPNILVDSNDTLKICDFGSLYSWDKTYMQSAIMSVCGTSQWMAPEMLKNEPCSEKVDIWAFAVILWELLVQEVPYKNITSLAIIFGVGSDNLRLHLPKSLPDTCKLLLKVCFAKRPRNRPSFYSILNHLANLEIEINSINEDGWSMRKEVWKREVTEQSEQLHQNNFNGNSRELSKEKLEELVKKRMNELRHAEELREMYLAKMSRADRMFNNLNVLLQRIKLYEEKLNEREQLVARAETVAPNTSSHYSPPPKTVNKHASVPELKSVKVKKSTVTSMRGKKTSTDVYSRAGQRAVVTMEVDDDSANNNAESEESLYESDAEEAEHLANWSSPNMCHAMEDQLPNIPAMLSPPMQERLVDGGSIVTTPKRRVSQSSSSDDEQFVNVPRSRHSYGSTSHQNSFEECCNSKFSSRAGSARSSMNLAQRRLAADIRQNRNSISHLPPYDHAIEDQQHQFVCPCCSYQFHRNCTARISGISNDSGVASTMDERRISALTLASICNEDCSCTQQLDCHGTDLYRNQQARWSDGRIYRYHNQNPGPASSAPRTQQHRSNRRQTGSFTRNSPCRRVTSASSAKRHRSGFDRNSTGCLQSVIVNDASMPGSSPNMCQVHSIYNSQPKLSNSHEDEDQEMPQEDNGLFIHSVIQEMDSSMSSKSNRSPKKSAIMDQSSASTMASSLERSLEMGIADGLSDKETKVRAAKSTFKTHRRCASNPTNIIDKNIARIIETSTESENDNNDPVYC